MSAELSVLAAAVEVINHGLGPRKQQAPVVLVPRKTRPKQ